MSLKQIELRGVEVHNLKAVDLDLPHRKLIVFCGVSGSGKTSLAFDTLYAEGQRRYMESFSAYMRQFLEQLEKPQADRIEGLPPAIAVTRKDTSKSSRSTVATATEIADHLRLLFARVGRVECYGCGQPVRRETPQSVAERIQTLPAGARVMIGFPLSIEADATAESVAEGLKEDGFVRVVVDDRLWNLASESLPGPHAPASLDVLVDRLTIGAVETPRLVDSLETAFAKSPGKCCVWIEPPAAVPSEPATTESASKEPATEGASTRLDLALPRTLDGRPWRRVVISSALACERCGIEYPTPEPRLYNFNSPLGACPACEGFGNTVEIDMARVVPDPGKTLREGAIAPWTTPAYVHELQELLALAAEYRIPVDVPFRDLPPEAVRRVKEGVPERAFGGLDGFFQWLEKHKYKMHLRVFLSRWRSPRLCTVCDGRRLRPEALAARIGGKNIADLMRMKIADAREFFARLPLDDAERTIGRAMLSQIESRLRYLESVGLGYLNLDRQVRTLSGGEGQRVALTSALGSSLVNMLYVLDEPSVGLHATDVDRLLGVVTELRDRGNTVVVVEHEEAMLRAADQLVEIGPAAGERGGQVVFQGTLPEMLKAVGSLTGDYLTGKRLISTPEKRRQPNHGWIRLTGARGHNLKNITVEFPLGVLCVVTGVSGAGKSTLVQDTLYGAICHRKHKEVEQTCAYDDVFGDGQIDDVVLVDQSPIGRSPRSNPVTYIKAFDQIRAVFAETLEARTHNYDASHFSFNVEGGRCETCNGDGYLEIDMQFLPDVFMKCSQCGGTRYRKEILDVRYRGRNIADVLEMTVREAFLFFRGQAKVQTKLKQLIDVGLDYLRLGQPANTLSAGEAQRLKLAAYMSSAGRSRTLFLLDEPTTGLHFADIVQLLDCFEALLNVGHSLIVVEHNLQLMKAADYIIDVGPDAAERGGQIVVQGTPEKVAHCQESATGRLLAQALQDVE